MVITRSPSTPAISPRSSDFSASPQIVDSPNSTSAKISAGPKRMAMRATRSTETIITARLNSPPNTETTTAVPSASPALPARASG
jgi:hypothetical protein